MQCEVTCKQQIKEAIDSEQASLADVMQKQVFLFCPVIIDTVWLKVCILHVQSKTSFSRINLRSPSRFQDVILLYKQGHPRGFWCHRTGVHYSLPKVTCLEQWEKAKQRGLGNQLTKLQLERHLGANGACSNFTEITSSVFYQKMALCYPCNKFAPYAPTML